MLLSRLRLMLVAAMLLSCCRALRGGSGAVGMVARGRGGLLGGAAARGRPLASTLFAESEAGVSWGALGLYEDLVDAVERLELDDERDSVAACGCAVVPAGPSLSSLSSSSCSTTAS